MVQAFLRRIFRLTPEEERQLHRSVAYAIWGFLLLSLFLLPLVKRGFFREQERQREARDLIQTGGYAYCAIWGDGADPFQLMPLNSPNRPTWKAERLNDGTYLMTFSYRRSGNVYTHQWNVDLLNKEVVTVTPHTRVPVNRDENNRECSDR